MGPFLKYNGNGFNFTGDLSNAQIIIRERLVNGSDFKQLNINIKPETTTHSIMSYTTDIETLELIFKNKTIRSSSLSNANLNDPMEKERVGVTEFASSRFIACFCHTEHECVPFWLNYGKSIRKNKVLLQFTNFATNFDNCFFTDYALVDGAKRCFFKSNDYITAINNQSNSNVSIDDYDLRACIDSISIFDVEYVPNDSTVFTEDYSGKATVDFGLVTGQENAIAELKKYDTTVLGKHKSDSWEYEKETRILCSLSIPSFKEWNYVDLRLKPEMFHGLTIVLSPWDDDTSKERVKSIVINSSLPTDIIKTIKIVDSNLKGKLNFPD